MYNLCSSEAEQLILEVARLNLNRKFIRIKESNWIGIVEIKNNTYIYEELDGITWALIDLVRPMIFKTRRELEQTFKDLF